MRHLGKTTSDRLKYGFLPKNHRIQGFSEVRHQELTTADLGETQRLQPSGDMKARLVSIRDERREKRTRESDLRLRALIVEAHTIGWSNQTIARVLWTNAGGIAIHLKKAGIGA